MKLVSLNIWGGKAFGPLMAFLKNASVDTDIFCFQEAFRCPKDPAESRGTRTNVLADLISGLKDFECYFCPVQTGIDLEGRVDFEIETGQAIFVRKSVRVKKAGQFFVYRNRNEAENMETVPAAVNYVQCESDDKKCTACNLHGIAFPGDKLDTPERLEQSRRILKFLEEVDGPKLLCGDFNLLPDTRSIRMLEEKMTNLISAFGIERTRSKLSPFYGKDDFQEFADFTFVSPDVRVKKFEVPDIEVSDHLPMVLEFDPHTYVR